MTTSKKPKDPLAGIPTGTANPAPSNVVNLNTAKKRRLSGQAFRDAQKFARDMVGYDNKSPIWGKRLIAVIGETNEQLEAAQTEFGAGNYADAEQHVNNAKLNMTELQKRLAYGQVMKAQS
jgi:hypothetical protein